MLTGILQKTMLSFIVNMGIFLGLWLVLPENFITLGEAIIWSSLGGVVRAILDATKNGRTQWHEMVVNGWHFVVIGGVTGAALTNSPIPFFGEYFKDLPANATHFLVGSLAVNAFGFVDEVMQIRLGFLRDKKDSEK